MTRTRLIACAVALAAAALQFGTDAGVDPFERGKKVGVTAAGEGFEVLYHAKGLEHGARRLASHVRHPEDAIALELAFHVGDDPGKLGVGFEQFLEGLVFRPEKLPRFVGGALGFSGDGFEEIEDPVHRRSSLCF